MSTPTPTTSNAYHEGLYKSPTSGPTEADKLQSPTSSHAPARKSLGSVPSSAVRSLAVYHELSEEERAKLKEPVAFPIFSAVWLADDRVLFGGGGGAAGTGIKSGVTCCRVIVGDSKSSLTLREYYKQHTDSKTERDYSNAYAGMTSNDLGLQTYAFINTSDQIVMHLAVNPSTPSDLCLALSNKTVILDLDYDMLVKNAIETDYGKDPQTKDLHCNLVQSFPNNTLGSTKDGGKLLATAGEDRVIQLWNYNTLKNIATKPGAHKDVVTSLSFSKKVEYLLSTGSGEPEIKVWKIPTSVTDANMPLTEKLTHKVGGKQLKWNAAQFFYTRDNASQLVLAIGSVSARGPSYAVLWRQNNMYEYVEAGTVKLSNNSAALVMALSADNEQFAVATGDGTVKILRTSNLSTVEERKQLHNGLPVTSLAFSPDGYWLLSASADQMIHFTKTQPHRWYHAVGVAARTILLCLVLALLFATVLETRPQLFNSTIGKLPYVSQHLQHSQPISNYIRWASDQQQWIERHGPARIRNLGRAVGKAQWDTIGWLHYQYLELLDIVRPYERKWMKQVFHPVIKPWLDWASQHQLAFHRGDHPLIDTVMQYVNQGKRALKQEL